MNLLRELVEEKGTARIWRDEMGTWWVMCGPRAWFGSTLALAVVAALVSEGV